MLEDTAFDLGYTSFEATDQVLRMADQSRVIPVGTTLLGADSNWRSDVFAELRYYPGKHRGTFSHATRKTMAVYRESISRLGSKRICIWKTKDSNPLEDGSIPWRNK